jgi:methyl-accepting chemotaxis protein
VSIIHRLSFGTKICVAAAACTVASLAVTGIAVGIQSSNNAEQAARDGVQATAQYAAQQVQSDMRASFASVESLANALQVAREADNPPPRPQLDATLKKLIEGNTPWLAAYSLWEPNAFDGKDAEHVSKGPQDDATGRFVSYWNRAKGSVDVEPLVDYEKPGTNDWYEIPRRKGKPVLIEPYLYKVSGKDTLITSLVVPVMVQGQFKGVVGIDLLLEGMQRTLAHVQTLPGAKIMLVSVGGKYVSHPDAARVGQEATELPAEVRQHVAKGEPYEYTDGAQAFVIVPVKPHPDAWPWGLAISYDVAAAKAPAYAVMKLTAAIAAGCCLLAVLALIGVVSYLTRPVRVLAATMKGLAGGESNLNVALAVEGHDELASIADAFNRFVAKLRTAFEDVRATSNAIDGAAGEISTGNMDLSSRTEQQASSLEEISASMTQLAEGVRNSAQTAQQADALSRQAGETATRSQGVMQEAINAMNDVHASSKRIADITAVIDGIAFQTNILALNAAVEAARAGEQGRGFSVVAGEVRTLAQRAAVAAKDIKSLIGESVTRIELGSDRIRNSGEAVADLVAAVNQTSHLVATISHASSEQSMGIAHVETAITQLDTVTQQNAALVEEAAAAAGSMKQQTRRLTDTLGQFI